jgi:hypothetical protein
MKRVLQVLLFVDMPFLLIHALEEKGERDQAVEERWIACSVESEDIDNRRQVLLKSSFEDMSSL